MIKELDIGTVKEPFNLYTERFNIGENLYKIRNYRGIILDEKFANKIGESISDIKYLEYGQAEIDIKGLVNLSTILKVPISLILNKKINWILVEIIDFYFKKTSQKELDFNKIINLIYLIDYEYFKINKISLTKIKYYLTDRGVFNENIFEIKEFFNQVENNYFKISRGISIKKYICLEDNNLREFLEIIFNKYSKLNFNELKTLTFKTEPLLKYNNEDEINKNIGIEVKF